MIPSLRSRSVYLSRRLLFRPYSTSVQNVPANDPKEPVPKPNVSATNATPTSSMGSHDSALVESPEAAEKIRQMQAPNRAGIWSRSQEPRDKAMVGPRFEQTIMEDQVWMLFIMLRYSVSGRDGHGHDALLSFIHLLGYRKNDHADIYAQPRPMAAIELIHKQSVRWRKERVVSCDGGGGPLGHPRIFINLDKPQICWCTYCGLPFVCLPLPSHNSGLMNLSRQMNIIASISSRYHIIRTLLNQLGTRQ